MLKGQASHNSLVVLSLVYYARYCDKLRESAVISTSLRVPPYSLAFALSISIGMSGDKQAFFTGVSFSLPALLMKPFY